MLDANVETLSLDIGSAVFGTGNAEDNMIFGNAPDNDLNGGGGADQLKGLGGNDTFIFQAGQANGDTVYEFDGNGAGAGDVLQFKGYGTLAQGATFAQLTATEWLITSANGLFRRPSRWPVRRRSTQATSYSCERIVRTSVEISASPLAERSLSGFRSIRITYHLGLALNTVDDNRSCGGSRGERQSAVAEQTKGDGK